MNKTIIVGEHEYDLRTDIRKEDRRDFLHALHWAGWPTSKIRKVADVFSELDKEEKCLTKLKQEAK